MMTLKVKVGESTDSQRGRRPPISDAAPPSFHTNTDGLGTGQSVNYTDKVDALRNSTLNKLSPA